jgi:hypothetical protein
MDSECGAISTWSTHARRLVVAVALTRQVTLAPGLHDAAPTDEATNTYGLSIKHGEGRVNIPRPDTTVHQNNRQCGCIRAA